MSKLALWHAASILLPLTCAASALAGGPPNDAWMSPMPLNAGTTPVSTDGATTDGPLHTSCDYGGQIDDDCWFIHVAVADGPYRISTCNMASFDTAVAVYDFFVPSDESLLGCSSDGAGCLGGGSIVVFDAVAGQPYLVRIGGEYPGEAGSSLVTVGPIEEFVRYSVIGGGAQGENIAQGGSWDFDALSPAQRSVPSDCSNSVAHPFGDIVEPFGWNPAPGTVSAWLRNPGSDRFGGWDPASQTIGGGMLAFSRVTEIGGEFVESFDAGHYAGMVSPAIVPARDGLVPESRLSLTFTTAMDPLHDYSSLMLVVRLHQMTTSGPVMEEHLVTLSAGVHSMRVTFATPLLAETLEVQFEVGCSNTNEKQPVAGPGPKVDDVKGEAEKPSGTKSKRNVPDITQGDTATCMASAMADCLSWMSKNGYPELRSDEGTEEEKNDELRDDLREEIYGDLDDDDDDVGDAGVTEYLKDKGVLKGQTPNPPPNDPNRPQLEHKRFSNGKATWDKLKREFEAGSDVVLRVQWYNADGELVDPDAAHYVCVAGVQTDGDKKCLQVANPWGDSTHEVNDDNREDAYEKLDVTVGEDGSIRIDNKDLEENAAGIEGAAYLCVTDINVIRKVGQGNLAGGSVRQVGAGENFAGGTTLYQYQTTNGFDTPLNYLALVIEVPYTDVSAPAGWTWEPLPAMYEGGSGCGNGIGPTGILFHTDTDPVLPGQTLGIFSFRALSVYPNEGEALIWHEDSLGGEGEYGVVAGPAPILCPADLDGDLDVGFGDLLVLLASWGPCDGCGADIDGSGSVDFTDLLNMLAAWGPCVN